MGICSQQTSLASVCAASLWPVQGLGFLWRKCLEKPEDLSETLFFWRCVQISLVIWKKSCVGIKNILIYLCHNKLVETCTLKLLKCLISVQVVTFREWCQLICVLFTIFYISGTGSKTIFSNILIRLCTTFIFILKNGSRSVTFPHPHVQVCCFKAREWSWCIHCFFTYIML